MSARAATPNKINVTVMTIILSLAGDHKSEKSRKGLILTTGIDPIFRGLKFEPDAEIGQKRAFCKGLKASILSGAQSTDDKAKSIVRWGRKATGL